MAIKSFPLHKSPEGKQDPVATCTEIKMVHRKKEKKMYQEISLGDTRASFARDFITSRNIDDVYDEVCQFSAEVCS